MSRKRLLQISRTAYVHGFPSDRCRVLRGHKNHGDRTTHRFQPAPHLNAGYTAQMNVEDNTRHAACAIAKKRLAAIENFGGKMRRVQYALESPQDTRIVVDDCDHLAFCWQRTASLCCGQGRLNANSMEPNPPIAMGSRLYSGTVERAITLKTCVNI